MVKYMKEEILFMDNKAVARSWFYSQPKLPVPECAENSAVKMYRLGYTGQYIVETEIDTGLGGESVEINQITDIHFNYVAISDETDTEVMKTREFRKWNAEAESVKSAIKAMDVAQYADQTIITGDVLDYISVGNARLTKKHILARDPEVIMTLGAHALTKQMQTGLPDETPIEERYAFLEEFWPHDMFYYSKTVGEKVIAVALDNSLGHFWEHQLDKLKADIEKARAEKKIVLLFMHEPIAARGKTEWVPALLKSPGARERQNYSSADIVGATFKDKATDDVYNLIISNADVIKGVFCGHNHSMLYVDIPATYTDESGTHEVTIPQLSSPGNPYFDHAGTVVRITVK